MLRFLAMLLSLATRSIATAPVWRAQESDFDAYPTAADDGVGLDVGGDLAGVALVSVTLREVPQARTSYLTIGTWSASALYTIDLGGGIIVTHNAATAPDADEAASLAALVAAVTADTDANALVAPSVVSGRVRLRGRAFSDYPVSFTATAGTVSVEADGAEAGSVQLVALAGDEWLPVASGRLTEIPTPGGFVERYEVAGATRLAVLIEGLTGPAGDGAGITYRDPVVRVAPCGGAA